MDCVKLKDILNKKEVKANDCQIMINGMIKSACLDVVRGLY